jgi:(p)ppGpp synthase/HD superfamily hydrolase
MSTLARAIEIAVAAHKGQKDKSGADYILHPLRVMQRGKTETEKICGALHDVIEDTDWTFEALEKEGFSEEVIAVLRCVTKLSEEEDYDSFIERVATNPIAIQVKINDLLDNMDITRLSRLTEMDIKRLNKYLKAYRKLSTKGLFIIKLNAKGPN